MLKGIWGTKIGMTQVFSDANTVVPVTAIDLNGWFVTNIKSKERDGYSAIQVGCVKKRYLDKDFSSDWLKNLRKYFSFVKEIKLIDTDAHFALGQSIDFLSALAAGEKVDVRGTTKGYGFQGVVKRHGFRGGSASHGPRFGRWPGSMSFMRSQGRVIKGKKLPGHMGCAQRVMRKLEIIMLEPNAKIALVKGSVPGHSGSLVFMQKA